jgi:hypothetical protein
MRAATTNHLRRGHSGLAGRFPQAASLISKNKRVSAGQRHTTIFRWECKWKNSYCAATRILSQMKKAAENCLAGGFSKSMDAFG